jgi:hypothetical protein
MWRIVEERVVPTGVVTRWLRAGQAAESSACRSRRRCGETEACEGSSAARCSVIGRATTMSFKVVLESGVWRTQRRSPIAQDGGEESCRYISTCYLCLCVVVSIRFQSCLGLSSQHSGVLFHHHPRDYVDTRGSSIRNGALTQKLPETHEAARLSSTSTSSSAPDTLSAHAETIHSLSLLLLLVLYTTGYHTRNFFVELALFLHRLHHNDDAHHPCFGQR